MKEQIDRLWRRIFYFGCVMFGIGFSFLFAAIRPENAHGWQIWVAAAALGMGIGSWFALYSMPRLLPHLIAYFIMRDLRRRSHD
jgi:drug/metabolite transporter (DMT)-like permease